MSFSLAGAHYEYRDTPWSRDNERRVEVPVVWEALKDFIKDKPKDTSGDVDLLRARVLEVGNVLAYHFPDRVRFWRTVDKYEKADGVDNLDVLAITGKRDLIVSISTLEHVGHDEHDRDESKALRAIWHLGSLLNPGGLLLFTIPLGYHRALDGAVRGGGFPGERRYLRRISAANDWSEVSESELGAAAYGSPFPYANFVAFCWVRS